MPEPAPELSLIVATHNRLELLRTKLSGLHQQDLEPNRFEVIVVADGCQDGTDEFLAGYGPHYGFKYLSTSGVGPARARNLAAAAAKGRFILLSDDDVLPHPKSLRLHLSAQQQQPGVYVGAMRWESGQARALSFRWGHLHWTTLNGANTSFPAQTFNQLGGFWEGFSGYGGEDLELGYRLAKGGLKFFYLKQAGSVHAGSPSLPDLYKARSAGRQAMQAYRHHRDAGLALELGVHPGLLVLKLALLPWAKKLLGSRGDYELAYAWGAWETRYDG
jgi:glycosyltransferase involved in cell wall biosynthesis